MGNIINDYARKEGECEYRFQNEGPFWHLCTPGEGQEIIFRSREDFKFAVTSMAMTLTELREAGRMVKLYAFAVMSNHVHEMLSGSKDDCLEYFRLWKIRLKRYFAGKVDLSGLECKLIHIKELKSLRYEAAYIHRNGFVNNVRETPFSYEWSTGMYYFNPITRKMPVSKVSDLSYRGRQQLFKSRVNYAYDDLSVYDGYISPMSFCEIEAGEFLFRDAHKYFYLISRSVESYSMIAKALGNRVFLNDEEMYGVVCKRAKELFKADSPHSLSPTAKIEMARMMHNEYNASNSQITRMLRLEKLVVEELFPKI